MTRFNLFMLLMIFTYTAYPQKSENLKSEIDDITQNLKDSYPDDEIAILDFTEKITFDFDSRKKNITARHSNELTYINLESRTTFPIILTYDEKSEIKKIRVTNSSDYPVNAYFKDEYFNNGEIFHSDARVKWYEMDFPVKGSKYGFSYIKDYSDVKYFTKTFFDDIFPIKSKKIEINVPDWLEIEIIEFNTDDLNITNEVQYDNRKKEKIYTYQVNNLSGLPKFNHLPGPTHYRPHLLFIIKSYTHNEIKTNFLSSTKDLYNWYHSLTTQLNNDSSVLEEKVLSLIDGIQSDEEKIKSIYYWVQDNIRYIAFEDGLAGFKPDEAQNVYKKKYGDCKGMANLTKEMLKIAGFDARLTWIGTNHIAYDYSYPSIAVDNHMICTVILNDKKYFLDSTEKYTSLGFNAERIQDRQVLIEDEENYILDKIPEAEFKYNKETYQADLFIDNGILKGKVSRTYHGESKFHFLYNINNLKTEKRDEALEWYIRKNDKNVSVTNIQVTDINDRDSKLQLNYDIGIKNIVNAFENDIYIDLDYYKELKNIDMEKRNIDFILPYKINERTSIFLKIPQGYNIKSLPKNLIFKNEDFEISFNYSFEKNTIKYTKDIVFKKAKITLENLDSWREFHPKLKAQYDNQIILSKT